VSNRFREGNFTTEDISPTDSTVWTSAGTLSSTSWNAYSSLHFLQAKHTKEPLVCHRRTNYLSWKSISWHRPDSFQTVQQNIACMHIYRSYIHSANENPGLITVPILQSAYLITLMICGQLRTFQSTILMSSVPSRFVFLSLKHCSSWKRNGSMMKASNPLL
jgi:hypothetical protein